MTPREELEQLFNQHNFAYPSPEAWRAGIQQAVWKWHLRHTPQVSRKQVEQVLQQHYLEPTYPMSLDNTVDHFLALLRGEKRHEWCQDIKWNPDVDGYEVPFNHGMLEVQDTWRVCPVCGKKRPDNG